MGVRRRILGAVILLAAALVVGRVAVVASDLPAHVTAGQFEALRHNLPRMRAFLNRMPKGGDLHTHLSGAVYAERLIAFGLRDGLCLRPADMTLLPPPADAPAAQPCGADPAVVPLAAAVSGPKGQATYDRLINALSLRWFLPTPETPSGHDQFFGTFGRFNAATSGPDWPSTLDRVAEMVVDQLKQYDATQVQYAEFMVTFFGGEDRRALGPVAAGESDPAAMLAALKAAGLDRVVATRAEQVRGLMRRIETLLDCDDARTRPGCGVTFRFIAQVNRNSPPAGVFAQTALSAALVRALPEVVAGFNYVGPEDYRISLADYRTHMAWIGFLAGQDVPVALHAGELWLGLVPPPDLDFHIRAAVEVAGARRIGHGTAIPFERDMEGLLKEMRRRGVTVEIALTSSDVILGVRGREHPLLTYLAAGVPITLATDDAGVSRIDLSGEYFRAARDQGIGYPTLKTFAHNGLKHAFLSGAQKQVELAKLDAAFTAFEASVMAEVSTGEKLRALLRALLPVSP